MATLKEMVDAVKAHAREHYTQDGWDYLVECFDDGDIIEIINKDGCKTTKQAINAVGKDVKTLGDYRDEIQATAW